MMKKLNFTKCFAWFAIATALACCSPLVQAAHGTYTEAMESGQAQIKEKKYAQARTDFTEALALAVNTGQKVSALFSVAASYSTEGNQEQARTEFDKVVTLEGVQPFFISRAYVAIGQTYITEKKFDLAREQFTKAVAVEGIPAVYKAMAQLSLANGFYSDQKYEEARIELAKILAIEGVLLNFQADAWIRTGDSFVAQKNYAEAKPAYEKALALPELPEAYKARIQRSLDSLPK